MTQLNATELHVLSNHYTFDEASVEDLALTIGIEKTKAICEFLRRPEKSSAQDPPHATSSNGFMSQQSSQGQAKRKPERKCHVGNRSLGVEDRVMLKTVAKCTTDHQNDSRKINGHARP